MTLTSEYQYIGRSNAVSNPAGANFYILLYAKASGDPVTGRHAVTVKQRLASTSGNYFYGWCTSGDAVVDGSTAFSWFWATIPSAEWTATQLTEDGTTYNRYVDLKEGTVTIDVGYGKTKDVTITAYWVMNDSNGSTWLPTANVYANVTATVTLPMIAGASGISAAAETVLGYSCNIKWTPMAEVLCYKLRFSMGMWEHTTGVIAPNKTGEYTYTGYVIPLEVAEQIPESANGRMLATLYTYADSSASVLVGSAEAEFTVRVPENDSTKPTVSIDALIPVSDLAAPFDSLFIQGKSKVRGTFSGTGKLGADILSYTMVVEGMSYEGQGDCTSDYLVGYGTTKVRVIATDSRGFAGEAVSDFNIEAYAAPKISVSMCERCDASGNLSDSGTYLRIRAGRTYNAVDSDGTQRNFCTIRCRYRTEAGSFGQWMTILAGEETGSDNVDSGAILGTLAADTTYLVQVGVADTLGSTGETSFTIPTEAVFMHERSGGRGLGLGKYCEEDDLLDVAWNLRVRGEIRVGESGMTLEEYIKSFLN